jgi:peptide/nickel transport system substrate-binding protein
MSGIFNLLSSHTMPLRDLRVRKALNYAVNKEELIRYAFKGNAIEMRGWLNEFSGVDLSGTKTYEWNIRKARELLEDAGYGHGFKMEVFCHEKDYLIGQFIQRFYSLLNVEMDLEPVTFEWAVRHVVYLNTREGYNWKDEDWWMFIGSGPGETPEPTGRWLESFHHSGAAWRHAPDWLLEPLEIIYKEVLETTDREKRFQLYKRANDYIADQALGLFIISPLSLYGVNEELNFVPHPSQYLYLDYSSVTENHWSIRGKNH